MLIQEAIQVQPSPTHIDGLVQQVEIQLEDVVMILLKILFLFLEQKEMLS